MSARDEKAARRRAEWSAEVVESGRGDKRLHATTSVAERLSALLDLSERAWIASGRSRPTPTSRAQWPGEVFECPRRG